MIYDILRYIARVFPRSFKRAIYRKVMLYKYSGQQKKYRKIVDSIKKKRIYRVAFFVLDSSVWKCDVLYNLMVNNACFEPIIIICPIVNKGRDYMLDRMNIAYDYFCNRHYNVIKSYDFENDIYLDISLVFNPDIIFYLNPYRGLIDDRYYITNFLDKLTCYVPYYCGGSSEYELAYDQPFHNLLWRFYSESEIHKQYSSKYAIIKDENVVVTGFPGTDKFICDSYKFNDVWKIRERNIKRIIWAPHQSIKPMGLIDYSCFIMCCQFMLDMAVKYKDYIQIAFKPHPLLQQNLYNHEGWGKERTNQYYNSWELLENGQLEDSDYSDLFLSSDALIHDSGSFMVEYLYINKPVLRVNKDKESRSLFNNFVQECYDVHYHAFTNEDVESFIQNVINDVDDKKAVRTMFVYNSLYPPNKKLASQNIIDDICYALEV